MLLNNNLKIAGIFFGSGRDERRRRRRRRRSSLHRSPGALFTMFRKITR